MGSATRTIGAGLLGAVFGALGMWLVLPRDAGSPAGGAIPAPPDPVRDARTPVRPDPTALPESPHLGSQPPAVDRAAPRDATAALSAAVEAVELVVPEGHGRITGRVRTKDGTPVAGVVVRGWTPYQDPAARRSVGAPPRPTVVERFRLMALNAKWMAATEREGRSDAEGSYALTDLVNAEYHLRAWATGYDIHSSGRGRAFDGTTFDFVATPVLTVPISVLAPDGTSPANASVRWSRTNGGGGGSAEWTSDAPDLAIEPGTWTLVASVGEELRSKPVLVTIGSTPEPVVLRLEVRNAIQGTVRFDTADKDWAHAFVTALRRGSSEKEAAKMKMLSARPPDWTFQFEDLEPGDYDVSVALADHAPVATELVRVVGGTAKVTVAVPRLAPAQVLEARVYGPDGTALSEQDVSFGLIQRSERSSLGIGTRSVHRPDGTFLIPLSSPSAVGQVRAGDREGRPGQEGGREADAASPSDGGRWRWFLVATSRTHGTKEVEFTFGVTPRIEVRFE